MATLLCRSDNLIFETLLYIVKFSINVVTLLIAKTIAQAMYAQYENDRNKYLLVECFVYVQKDPTAIILDKQRAIHNDREYLHHTTVDWFVCCQWKTSFM